MPAQVFPLDDRRRTWVFYAILMGAVSALFFASLVHHKLDNHDAETFRDNARISEDFWFFFSPEKEQASGRPAAELTKWVASLFLGEDPGLFHLLVVATHTLASLLLAFLCRRLGINLELSLLGGLLFLVNVTHFQGVHWISALDYPLALVWSFLGVLCYLRYCDASRAGWLVGLHAGLGIGVLTHMAAAAAGPLCLYWSWHQGHDLKTALRRLVPLGAVLALLVFFALRLTEQKTSTWATLDYHAVQGVAASFLGIVRMLLWYVGRLLTTAHWLPLSVYKLQPWELYFGGAVLAGILVLIWKKVFPLSVWGMWILLSLFPFLTIPENLIFQFLKEGPSRYLYLATAGSSVLLAWVLQQMALRLRSWGPFLLPVVLAALLVSSYAGLKRLEGFSFYLSGRHYIAADRIDEGVGELRRAIDQAGEAIPLQDAYLRLSTALLYLGEDPRPVLDQALRRFPTDFMLRAIVAVLEAESSAPDVRQRGQTWLGAATRRAATAGLENVFKRHLSTLYTNLGKGYVRREDPLPAIQAYQRALEYTPDRDMTVQSLSRAYALLGLQLDGQQRMEEAVSPLQRAVDLDPANLEARLHLGWLRYRQGHLQEAISHYRQVLARGLNSRAQFRLGLAYLVQGNVPAAEDAFGRAVRFFGASEGAHLGVVDHLQKLIDEDVQAGAARRILQAYWNL